MSTGKVLVGVLAGVAVGATLGILFAPDKGSNTRKKIAKKSGEYVDDLGDSVNEFLSGVKERFESIKKDAVDEVENVKNKARTAERTAER